MDAAGTSAIVGGSTSVGGSSGGETNTDGGTGAGGSLVCEEGADLTIDNTFGVNEGDASAAGAITLQTPVPARTLVQLHLWEWTDQGAGLAQLEKITFTDARPVMRFAIRNTKPGSYRLGVGVDRSGDGDTADPGERGWYPGGASSPTEATTLEFVAGDCLSGLDFTVP